MRKFRSRIDRLKGRYPLFKRYPFLIWLLLPLFLILLKGVQAVGFGTLLVVISGFLKDKLNIEVSNLIIALVLGVLLWLLIYMVYRIVRYIKKNRKRQQSGS